MAKTDQNELKKPTQLQDVQGMLGCVIDRRAFIAAGLTWLFAGAFASPAEAKRRRRRGRRRRGRGRAVRRRAIRRFRRRGGALENHARQAIRQGEIRPLRDVMAMVRRRSNAEVLDVDLHKRPDGWIYALRILTRRGRVRDVFLDARTLDVLLLAGEGGQDGVPLPPGLQEPGSSRKRPDNPARPVKPARPAMPARPSNLAAPPQSAPPALPRAPLAPAQRPRQLIPPAPFPAKPLN